MNGISALIRRKPPGALVHSILWGYKDKSVTWKRALT